MEKPSKPRRRRSIRNLRASTGFYSAPEIEAPSYGSAWIEQNQETNMENLVMSLSQLSCDDKLADGSCATDGESNPICSYSQYPNIQTASLHSPDLLNRLHFEDRVTADQDISPTIPFYDSFSFREDMPLNVKSVETDPERPYSPTCFPYETLSKTYGSDCKGSDQDSREIQSDSGDRDLKTISRISNVEAEYRADYFNLEQENSNLSLNFSPLPEEDQSINCLVKSLNCGFNLSFSPQGDRPDTPKNSHYQNDKDKECVSSAFPLQTASVSTSPNVSTTSEPNSFELNQTFVALKGVGETDSIRNSSPFTQIPVFPPDPHSDDISGTNIDLEKGLSPNYKKIANIDNIEHSKDSSTSINIPQSYVLNEINCQDSFNINDLTYNVTLDTIQENSFCEGIEESYLHLAMESNEEHSSDIVSINVGEIATEKQKKRQKRRSSRKFQPQEFSVAFCDSDNNDPTGVTSVTNFNSHELHSMNISEFEKENFCDDNAEFSFRDKFDKSVLSDCSNNQNVGKRKKSGRKSNGRNHLKSKKVSISVDTHDSVSPCENIDTCPHVNYHAESDCCHQSQCQKDCDSFDSDRTSGLSSNPEHNISKDTCEENDPAPSGRTLRTKRKSWGISTSHQPAANHSVIKASDESESQVRASCQDNVDPEQVYLQKKYSPITPRLLETIKEVPGRGLLIGKQKIKRFIHFPEDLRPTVWKKKSRTKKAIKHFGKWEEFNRIDEEEFHSRFQDIMIDLAEFDD